MINTYLCLCQALKAFRCGGESRFMFTYYQHFPSHFSIIKMAATTTTTPSKDVEKNAVVLEDTQSREDKFTRTQRILIVAAVCFAQFLGLLDQTAVNTAVPTIARSLNTGASISWIASSFLASSTATQLIIGRL